MKSMKKKAKVPLGMCQANIIVPKTLKEALQRIARLRSVEQDREISYADVVREEMEKIATLSGSYKREVKNG